MPSDQAVANRIRHQIRRATEDLVRDWNRSLVNSTEIPNEEQIGIQAGLKYQQE